MKGLLKRLLRRTEPAKEAGRLSTSAPKKQEIKLPELKAVCGDDSEVYEALCNTMLLTPWLLKVSMDEAAEKGDYMTAGGLALYEGNIAKVKEYFGLTGKPLKILEIPERAVDKAQEYYAKCPINRS